MASGNLGPRFDEIENFIKNDKNNREAFLESLITLEKLLFNLREKRGENLPIYLTKFRIKDPKSIFLKLKRKPDPNGFKTLKDIAAIRIITLFENDLFKVCSEIMTALSAQEGKWNKYKVTKAEAYNYSIEKRKELRNIFDNNCKDVIFKPEVPETKKSGYKSIHLDFVYNGDVNHPIFIEMQLRTLLQNAWGEIEHTLSYKQGDIQPHLKRSFQLLADDLDRADQLLNHLKDISTDDKVSKYIGQDSFIPNGYFDYQGDVSLSFDSGSELDKSYTDYCNLAYCHLVEKQPSSKSEQEAAIKILAGKFNEIRIPVGRQGYGKNMEYEYWVKMEDAFYKSWIDGEVGRDEALEIYTKMIGDHKENYFVPYYRRGELYLSKVETSVFEALNDFDMCERILAAKNHKNINTYLVLGYLASAYSTLGKEYIDLAIVKANEAEEIYIEMPDNPFFTPLRVSKYYNNKCWLYLLKYGYLMESDKKHEKDEEEKIERQKRDAFDSVQKYFNLLLPALKEFPKNSHYFDTIAWGYFQMYLLDHDKNKLDLAAKNIRTNYERENTSTFGHLSNKIQMFHYQQIMKEVDRIDLYRNE